MKIETFVWFGFVLIMVVYFIFAFIAFGKESSFARECNAGGGITLRTFDGLACADKIILLANK